MQRQAALVVAHDRVGGARDGLLDAKAAGDPFGERRLPRAERPGEQEDGAGLETSADPLAYGARIGVGGGGDSQGSSPFSWSW